MWGSTFLVESMGMIEENAAKTIMFYYMGMAFGRFLSGVLASNLSSWKIIYLGCGVLALSLFMLFLSLGPVMTAFALFFVGVGNGPIFPNLTHLTPQNFGKDISQSVMGSQMAAAYIGIMVFPPFYGIVAQNITPDVFPYYISIFFVIMAISVALLRREVKRSM